MTQIQPQSMPQGFPAELVGSTVFLLKRLGMAGKEWTIERYEELGLHPYNHAILALLDEGAVETQGAIADALGYDRGQLVGLLDDLEEAGYVERHRDPDDRRRHVVHITGAGRKMLERVRRVSRRLDDEFLASLSEREQEQLHALLLKVAESQLPGCAAKTRTG